LARRTGQYLCVADKENYSVIDLEKASLFPILPLSQAPDPSLMVVKPSITVVSEHEFLILSWTGSGTIGIFITGDGDPVRGTLEWPSHPEDVCMYEFGPQSLEFLFLQIPHHLLRQDIFQNAFV
jgi:hypothetical protein